MKSSTDTLISPNFRARKLPGSSVDPVGVSSFPLNISISLQFLPLVQRGTILASLFYFQTPKCLRKQTFSRSKPDDSSAGPSISPEKTKNGVKICGEYWIEAQWIYLIRVKDVSSPFFSSIVQWGKIAAVACLFRGVAVHMAARRPSLGSKILLWVRRNTRSWELFEPANEKSYGLYQKKRSIVQF